MKKFLLAMALFSIQCSPSCDAFALEPETIGIKDADTIDFYSIAPDAFILEDKQHELTFESVKNPSADIQSKFSIIGEHNANLDFTSSSYWIKFKIKNEDAFAKKFFLEVARPLTNIANLYTVYENGFTIEQKNGDELAFFKREIQHRKLLYPVQFQAKEELTFFLELRSDGEVISLPIKLWRPEAMMRKDYNELYMFGFYYGILIFVIIIYFFFYIALREKSFLYYVSYVFFILILQMSLDGLSFQYLWKNSVWWGNHVIVISATFTALFVLLYAKTFLKLKQKLPRLNNVFNFFMVLCGVNLILAIASGKMYAIAFPVTNGLSLLSALLVVIAIFISLNRKHKVSWFFTSAFIALITGAIIFILSNFNIVPVTFFTEHSLKFGSAVEIIFLSLSMANKYREIQQEKELAQAESLRVLQENETIIREQNIVLEQKVKERTAEVVKQKEIIEEKNKDITDSINYAQGIQKSILPPDDTFKKFLPDSFILFRPRDIVSGDFYWIAPLNSPEEATTNAQAGSVEHSQIPPLESGGSLLFAVCDCTGHGVPGGFVSMVGSNSLSRTVTEQGIYEPAKILDRVAVLVEETFSVGKRKDGMDVALCSTDFQSLQFAGANNPLYFIRKKENGKLSENGKELEPDLENETHYFFQIDADKQPVGAYEYRKPFTNHTYNLKKGDTIYLSSDGFRDQFGGSQGKKFMTKNFKKILLSIQNKPMEEQKKFLLETIENWMSGYRQNDDICVLGVRI